MLFFVCYKIFCYICPEIWAYYMLCRLLSVIWRI